MRHSEADLLRLLKGPLFHLEDKNEETCEKDNDHSSDVVTAYAFDSADNASQASQEESFQARFNTTERKPGKLAQIQFVSTAAK